MIQKTLDADEAKSSGPQSTLERKFLEEYLANKGYTLSDLDRLPQDRAKALRKEACHYASLKLAEVESKARFRHELHLPD